MINTTPVQTPAMFCILPTSRPHGFGRFVSTALAMLGFGFLTSPRRRCDHRFTGQAKTVLILSRSASAVSQTQNKKLSNKIEGRDRAISTHGENSKPELAEGRVNFFFLKYYLLNVLLPVRERRVRLGHRLEQLRGT